MNLGNILEKIKDTFEFDTTVRINLLHYEDRNIYDKNIEYWKTIPPNTSPQEKKEQVDGIGQLLLNNKKYRKQIEDWEEKNVAEFMDKLYELLDVKEDKSESGVTGQQEEGFEEESNTIEDETQNAFTEDIFQISLNPVLSLLFTIFLLLNPSVTQSFTSIGPPICHNDLSNIYTQPELKFTKDELQNVVCEDSPLFKNTVNNLEPNRTYIFSDFDINDDNKEKDDGTQEGSEVAENKQEKEGLKNDETVEADDEITTPSLSQMSTDLTDNILSNEQMKKKYKILENRDIDKLKEIHKIMMNKVEFLEGTLLQK
jgi:hypothetical protein